NEHYLRKKFKDPVNNDEFQVLMRGRTRPGAATGGRGSAAGPATGRGTSLGPTAPPGPQTAPGQPTTGGRGAGVVGVASKSSGQSIRIYNGATHYNEWRFVFTPTVQSPGGIPGAPGQRGGPGQRPGGPGPGPITGPGTHPFAPIGPSGRLVSRKKYRSRAGAIHSDVPV